MSGRLYRALFAHSFSRYLSVGVLSNGMLYLTYLLLTSAGMFPFLAMTLVYLLGVAFTYLLNSRWSFRHRGGLAVASAYTIVYVFGYLVNLGVFDVLHNKLGVAHQLTMLTSLLVAALFIYSSLRLFVFKNIMPTNFLERPILGGGLLQKKSSKSAPRGTT